MKNGDNNFTIKDSQVSFKISQEPKGVDKSISQNFTSRTDNTTKATNFLPIVGSRQMSFKINPEV